MTTNLMTEATKIEILSEKILNVLNDFSISHYSMCFAHYLIVEKKYDLEFCLGLIEKQAFPRIFRKLLKTKSEIFGITPRSIGINIVESNLRDGLQASLNVKHLKNASNDQISNSDIIIPELKEDILYSHPIYIWIRFYSENYIDLPKIKVHKIGDNIYEAYFKKTKNNVSCQICTKEGKVKVTCSKNNYIVTNFIRLIDIWGGQVIFCSELDLFRYNLSLFISNFVKFMYCYESGNLIFEIYNTVQAKLVNSLFITCFIFLNSSNARLMSDATHGPLIKYTGDNPANELKKCKYNHLYNNTGSRAAISMDSPDDMGAFSNYIEIIGDFTIKNSNQCIDNII